jgi:hypothetical protein
MQIGNARKTLAYVVVVIALLGVAALLVPVAVGARATLGATGVIAGSGPYTLTVVNTGDEPINCITLEMPLGVTVTAVSGPGFAAPFPAGGLSGFGVVRIGLAAGATAVYEFATAAPYPPNGGGTMRIQGVCPDFNAPRATIAVTGPAPPAPPPPPPPPPQPCACSEVAVRVAPGSVRVAPNGGYSFRLRWTMECAGETGRCRGAIAIGAPAGFRVASPRTKTIACIGACTGASNGSVLVRGVAPPAAIRAGKRFTISFGRTCLVDGGRVAAARSTLVLAFDRSGNLDRRRSDLDADGRKDGK